jgi:hypothetical protein
MFKNFNPFQKPKANQIIEESLEEYERQLLTHEAAAAYHGKMAEYYREGITRLSGNTKTTATVD